MHAKNGTFRILLSASYKNIHLRSVPFPSQCYDYMYWRDYNNHDDLSENSPQYTNNIPCEGLIFISA